MDVKGQPRKDTELKISSWAGTTNAICEGILINQDHRGQLRPREKKNDSIKIIQKVQHK